MQKLWWRHLTKDLAVLKIKASEAAKKPLPVGGTSHDLKGRAVCPLPLAIHLVLDQTLTTGVISALEERLNL